MNIPVETKKWSLSKKERLGMMGLSTGKYPHHQGGALIMKFKQSDGQNQRIERITTSRAFCTSGYPYFSLPTT